MDTHYIGFIPLASFPFPYKYLISIAFYFYIKNQVVDKEKVISKSEYLLFLPAVLYGLLRLYWYIMLHSGIDEDIFWNIYVSGFFIYNDFVHLTFSLIVMLFALKFLKKNSNRIKGSISVRKNWIWLSTFSKVLIVIIILNLIHQIAANLFDLEHSGKFYYAILVLNSIYIYWIGFIGFTKSKLLFKTYSFKNEEQELNTTDSIKSKFDYFINREEVFTNRNLKVSDLAKLLSIQDKELSLYINDSYNMSFSDFINKCRVEKVKNLLLSSEQEKFTLLAMAEHSGFSSKSNFNAVFKKVTGLTPTQYKKVNEK